METRPPGKCFRCVQYVIDIVKAIQAGGAPIDTVGAQAHALDLEGVPSATMKQLLIKRHADTGLPVHIDQYYIGTVGDDAQLAICMEHIPQFRAHGITIFTV
ncbi:MAG: endo-1,4-beta-xylanase [Deltaproteobacteria bacterium]|nr:endo-1,4-beta-xylanase [Deltaproteobacteria bacterium]